MLVYQNNNKESAVCQKARLPLPLTTQHRLRKLRKVAKRGLNTRYILQLLRFIHRAHQATSHLLQLDPPHHHLHRAPPHHSDPPHPALLGPQPAQRALQALMAQATTVQLAKGKAREKEKARRERRTLERVVERVMDMVARAKGAARHRHIPLQAHGHLEHYGRELLREVQFLVRSTHQSQHQSTSQAHVHSQSPRQSTPQTLPLLHPPAPHPRVRPRSFLPPLLLLSQPLRFRPFRRPTGE
mmetsp:Transcript_16051/g.35277  ORF Transcript_16051/g.35277 Transcript_16051/m.35277 type:complete len:242 (-) Transcript_16051:1164-1889(-)